MVVVGREDPPMNSRRPAAPPPAHKGDLGVRQRTGPGPDPDPDVDATAPPCPCPAPPVWPWGASVRPRAALSLISSRCCSLQGG